MQLSPGTVLLINGRGGNEDKSNHLTSLTAFNVLYSVAAAGKEVYA